MTTQPTNKDIMKLLGIIQDDNSRQYKDNAKRLTGIEDQVKYTNGKVRSLLEWRSNQEAVEKYKQTASPTVSVTTGATDWPKIVLTILGLLGTALAIVATAVSK